MVVGPHSSMLDIFIIGCKGIPTALCRAEDKNVPFFGSKQPRVGRGLCCNWVGGGGGGAEWSADH